MKFFHTIVSLFLFAGISVAGYQIVATINAPDADISGLGFGNGSLWAVDHVTEYAYQVDPATGTIQNSWYCADPFNPYTPSGLTFANNKVYIMVNRYNFLASCYMYDTSGNKLGYFNPAC
ncbi:MAG: hypothetical protein KAR40_14240 [Candidatus Sabulitectum sp.]|nr:hypothetical protein [Candidatus Sabulitectum sp.]